MKFQNAPFKNQKMSGKVFTLFLAFFVLAGASDNSQKTIYAQDNGTEIEKQFNRTRKKTTPPPPPSRSSNKTKKSPVAPKKSAVITKSNSSVKKNPPIKVEERLPVTFKTGAVAVEIWSDGKKIGISDGSAKLPGSLSVGEHLIVARKYDQDLFKPIKITVSADQNNFDFSADIAKALDEIGQARPDEMINKEPEPPAVDANAILKSYQDPQTTDSVTVKDWQAVYEQCRSTVELGNKNNNVEALCSFAQGQIELSLENRPKALSLFSAAILLLPNSPILYYGLGVAQTAAGNTVDATQSFLKVIKLDNKFALAHQQLGDIYQKQNRTKEAASAYQQALKYGVKKPEVRLKIAEIQIKNKNCGAAITELEALRAEAPTADVLKTLGDCYLEQGRVVGAVDVFNKAIELSPNSAQLHYRLGNIYLKQKEFGKARDSFERVSALDPEGKTVNRKELQELIEKAQKKVNNE